MITWVWFMQLLHNKCLPRMIKQFSRYFCSTYSTAIEDVFSHFLWNTANTLCPYFLFQLQFSWFLLQTAKSVSQLQFTDSYSQNNQLNKQKTTTTTKPTRQSWLGFELCTTNFVHNINGISILPFILPLKRGCEPFRVGRVASIGLWPYFLTLSHPIPTPSGHRWIWLDPVLWLCVRHFSFFCFASTVRSQLSTHSLWGRKGGEKERRETWKRTLSPFTKSPDHTVNWARSVWERERHTHNSSLTLRQDFLLCHIYDL